jgi:hypothetical protein
MQPQLFAVMWKSNARWFSAAALPEGASQGVSESAAAGGAGEFSASPGEAAAAAPASSVTGEGAGESAGAMASAGHGDAAGAEQPRNRLFVYNISWEVTDEVGSTA